MYDDEPQPREKIMETSLVVKDDTLGGYDVYEEILEPKTGETCFIDKHGNKHMEVYKEGITYRPIPATDDAVTQGTILFPTGIMDYGTTKELIEEIHVFIHKYLEINPRFEKIASWYVLFTWIYDRLDIVPYLRVRGDTGTGKNRFQDVIGGICYKPLFTAGAVTPAVMYRVISRFKGTLIIDEADFYKSDATNEIIKILNCGFQRGRPVARCQKDNPDNIQYFDTFCPKVLSTRKDFRDKATENRCLTHINRELTRTDIPINLPREFYHEQAILRNKLLKWRLDHYNKIDTDLAQTFDLGANLSPRLRQVMEGFPLLFYDDLEMMQFFRETLLELDNELKEERSASYEGIIVNILLQKYDEGCLHVTVGDIAQEIKEKDGWGWVTPQSVGSRLKSLGIKTQPPKRIDGKVKRCIKWEPQLIQQLRMRYHINNGTQTENIATLNDWGKGCNTPPTGENVTSVTSVTTHRETNTDISKKSNLYNKDTVKHPVPQGVVTDVTVVTPQGRKQLQLESSINIEDKNNGRNNGREVAFSCDPLSQRDALHEAIRRHASDGMGVHLANLRDDNVLMAHFESEGELYDFIEYLLKERDGGIYEPFGGYLQLTSPEET